MIIWHVRDDSLKQSRFYRTYTKRFSIRRLYCSCWYWRWRVVLWGGGGGGILIGSQNWWVIGFAQSWRHHSSIIYSANSLFIFVLIVFPGTQQISGKTANYVCTYRIHDHLTRAWWHIRDTLENCQEFTTRDFESNWSETRRLDCTCVSWRWRDVVNSY